MIDIAMLQNLGRYLKLISSLWNLLQTLLCKSSQICDTLNLWTSAILFSEKKSKVWKKMCSFEAGIFISTTMNGVLKKQYNKIIHNC